MRKQLVNTVSQVIKNDSKSVMLLGDIGVYGFRNIFQKFPNRIFNIGILEQSTISLAAGLAIDGLIPIVHTIAPFLIERSYEQIKLDLCYQELGANLISVGGSYDYAALGCTHHCPADVNIVNQIPNSQIIVPGSAKEFDRIFNKAYNNNYTTYFRLSSRTNQSSFNFKLGKNYLIKKGKKLLIVVVGPMLQPVIDATYDMDISIIYCNTVRPFDIKSIIPFANDKLLIIEPYYSGAILSNINEKGISFKNIECIGVKKEFINKYGTVDEIDRYLGLDRASLRKKILKCKNEK